MRRYTLTLVSLILLSIGGLIAACSSEPPDIDVAVDYDLGTVVKGDLAIADLPVRNLGDRPLNVLGVSTSCGCTKATLSPTTIPPQAEGNLHIVYDSDAHEEDLGAIERRVYISSDDPDEDEVQIKVIVFVEASTS
jgi:hypothetical protein